MFMYGQAQQKLNFIVIIITPLNAFPALRGDGVAQLVSRRTQDPKDEAWNPVRGTRTFVGFSESKL